MHARSIILCLLCFSILIPVAAQVDMLPDMGGCRITTRLLEGFEKKPAWSASVPAPGKGEEQGLVITAQLRRGCPAALSSYDVLDKLPDAEQTQQWVLGVKIVIHEPGVYEVAVAPPAPVVINGHVQIFSCWVHGRNTPDTLVCLFNDKDQEPLYALELGRLNYMGWKKLTTVIPGSLQQAAGPFSFAGFRLILSPLDLQAGTLYYYFDFITATAGELADE